MQISKKTLPKEVFSRLFLLLYEVVGKEVTEDEFARILNDIFSINEQVMIAKRVAIIYLAIKGIGVNEIAKSLKTSPATSSKFSSLGLESKFLFDFFNKKIKKEKLINLLDEIFYYLISDPTRYGTDWAAGWKIEMERQRKKSRLL